MSNFNMTILEGNIGVGKSTVARRLGQLLGCDTRVFLEPDEKATDAGGRVGNPYLKLYYGEGSDDPPVVQAAMRRWSYTMQSHLLFRRAAIQRVAQAHVVAGLGYAICDRSYHGDTVFAGVQIARGLMDANEAETYEFAFRNETAGILHPNICVRFHADPVTLQRRIAKRTEKETGRSCEKVIPLDYLQDLEVGLDHMTDVLRDHGVKMIDFEWGEDRGTEESREDALRALASRIARFEPRDRWLYRHGRMT